MAILGIDEVGRGPLAGPLVVGAVILPKDRPEWVEELRDSKALSKTKRRYLSEIIIDEAPAYGLGWVWPKEIDELGMPEALKKATRQAVLEVQKKKVPFSEIIIDGDTNFLEGTSLEPYTTTLIKGDDKIKEISAASIIAKVARDDYMIEKSEEYPAYGWERNMGYGTPEHKEAIYDYGLTPEHRLSFEPCKSISGFKPTWRKKKNTTKIGKRAERAVARYLESLGQDILYMNYENRYSEIDIISWNMAKEKLYFTEVKYRKNDDFGGGLAAIDKEKLEHMELAVKLFMKLHGKRGYMYALSDPILAVASVSGPDFEVDDWFTLD